MAAANTFNVTYVPPLVICLCLKCIHPKAMIINIIIFFSSHFVFVVYKTFHIYVHTMIALYNKYVLRDDIFTAMYIFFSSFVFVLFLT